MDVLESLWNGWKSARHNAQRSPRRRLSSARFFVDALERRDVPATIGPLPNVSVPANTGIPVTIVGGTNPQSYTVTSTNPNISPSVIQGQFLTFDISHATSGANDPQIVNQKMTYQLFDQLTPVTTSRIKELVNNGFYTGKVFHRIANGFPDTSGYIIQGGSVNGDGTGEVNRPGFPFEDEFVQSLIFDTKYQLAMANAGPDTNGSQFFVTTGQPQFLNYKHTIFGQIVEGQSLVDQLTTVALNGTTPKNPVIINSATLSSANNNGVILLNANNALTGQSATITVTATDLVDGSTATQTFQVNMIDSPVVNRPFLKPVQLQPAYKSDTTASFFLEVSNRQTGSTYNYVVASGIQFNPVTGQQEFIPVTNATVNINQATGEVKITPQAGFTGPLNLLVGVRDQVDRSGTGNLNNPSNYDRQDITLNFTLDAPTPPVAQPQSVNRTPYEEFVDIQLVGIPGDPNVPTTLTYTIRTNPSNGTLLNFDPATGTVRYHATNGFIGSDSFTFSVTDSQGLTSNPATVTIVALAQRTGAVRVQNGVLIVTPPPGRSNNMVELVPVGNGGIRVIVNGIADENQPFASNLKRIVLFGSKNNDTFAIDPSITVPASLNGGMGGSNTLKAGGGRAILQGWYGKRNTLQGGSQRDLLIGRAGHVRFLKSDGNDVMYASDSGAPMQGPRGTFYRWIGNRLVPVRRLN
jgi:cyclophilin family peptidyl-prolyl cis-trans isomerase